MSGTTNPSPFLPNRLQEEHSGIWTGIFSSDCPNRTFPLHNRRRTRPPCAGPQNPANGRSGVCAAPSALYRASHLRAVRGQTPAARAAASGICPLSISFTNRSRPSGVKRAFLWMFIRLLQEDLKSGNSSLLGQGRMDNLLKAHI